MRDELNELRARYKRLQLLHDVSNVIRSSLDPQEAMNLIVAEAVRITLWFDANLPSSTSTNNAFAEKDSGEPPLVFQTVARLNLAGVSQRSASSGSSSNSASGPMSSPAQPPGQGGGR